MLSKQSGFEIGNFKAMTLNSWNILLIMFLYMYNKSVKVDTKNSLNGGNSFIERYF